MQPNHLQNSNKAAKFKGAYVVDTHLVYKIITFIVT